MAAGLLDGLNERQREAVTAGDGAVLVLAGPGSGKTRVLTHRIAYLIQDMGVDPERIVAVTFTNKAAAEMRQRVEKLLNGSQRGLLIGTFHAICARLLRREHLRTEYGADFAIYDTDDQTTVVTQALSELDVDLKKFPPRQVLNAISSAKNELISAKNFAGHNYFGEVVRRAYPRYQQILIDNNAMDFDDLLMNMALLMREDPDVREKYQRWFEYILVDEFQDTNTAQYQLVRTFAAPQNNAFVVGDEDQAIYAFRGADYRNVAQFRRDYNDAKVILLEENYRSTQIVLDVARALIDKNTHRTPKHLQAARGESGRLVTVYEAYDQDDEARFIVRKAKDLRDSRKFDYRDVAVMYRTNAQSRALEDAFVQAGIPFRLVGGVGFYKRREVKDLLAYLRLINNPNDTVSFARVINTPKRGIGKKSIEDFQRWASDKRINYSEALDRLGRGEQTPLGSKGRAFAEFGAMINEWRSVAAQNDLLALFDEIRARIGFSSYLREMSDTPEQIAEREENVQELRNLIAAAKDESLTDFINDVALVAEVDSLKEDADAVTLLTLHAAKGLEYPIVFLTGLEEGILPHVRSKEEPEGMEEERRLMYVGVTRAKEQVYLTYAFRRMSYGDSRISEPSRFLMDVPEALTEGMPAKLSGSAVQRGFKEMTTWDSPRRQQDAPERDSSRGYNTRVGSKIVPFRPQVQPNKFRAGQRVSHSTFGEGIVIDSQRVGDDEEVTIMFEKSGTKRLSAEFARLTILRG